MNEVLLLYWKYSETLYVDTAGMPTVELYKLAQAIVQLKDLRRNTRLGIWSGRAGGGSAEDDRAQLGSHDNQPAHLVH